MPKGSHERKQQDEDLSCLDKMIADVGSSHDAASCDLFLEHLRAARRYLLGSMAGEYRFSLQQAKESVIAIEDKTARVETKEILQNLIGPGVPRQQSATASREYALPSPAPLASSL